MVHATPNNKKASTRRRQRANERWKRRRSYTHAHTVDRLSSFINPRDRRRRRRRRRPHRYCHASCCFCGAAAPSPPSFTAVRIEQFLTDVRRRVYGPVSAACLGRGGGGGAEEREGERGRGGVSEGYRSIDSVAASVKGRTRREREGDGQTDR